MMEAGLCSILFVEHDLHVRTTAKLVQRLQPA